MRLPSLICCLLMTAVPAQSQELVGEWDCVVPGADLVTYRAGYGVDGRFETFMIAMGEHEGQQVSVDLLVQGRWRIDDGKLHENLSRVTVQTLYLGDDDVTRSARGAPLRQAIEATAAEDPAPAPIAFEGYDRFRLDGSQRRMTCERVQLVE